MTWQTVAWLGQACQQWRGDGPSIAVCPERGGKIVSLLDPSGREWLAGPDQRAWSLPMNTQSFVDSDMSGWDECVPTVVACEWNESGYPDHGEAWSRPWSTIHLSADTLTHRFVGTWFDLERTISPTADGLTIGYAAQSKIHEDRPFLWAAHPQFRAPTGSRVVLPPSVGFAIDALDPAASAEPWSPVLASNSTLGIRESRKHYPTPEVPVGTAMLVRPDGSWLRMDWDDQFAPYVGIWMDHAQYARENVIAIEPATGWFDNAATSAENGRCVVLRGTQRLAWDLRITIGQ